MESLLVKRLFCLGRKEQGQVLLITILVMVVVLTVGLATVSRTVVQLKTSKDEAQSQQAFSAAQAGVQQALKTGNQITNQSLGNSASINNVTINAMQNATVLVNNGTQIMQDDGTDIWLSTYPTYQNPWSGRLRVYWGSATNCSEAALQIIVIAGTSPNYTINRYGADPCASRISAGNNFTQVTTNSQGTVSGQNFNYSFPIDVTNGVLARVIPLYHNTTLGVVGYIDGTETTTKALPSQGKLITSTGVSGTTQRTVSYFQGYNSVPPELFYTLFSP